MWRWVAPAIRVAGVLGAAMLAALSIVLDAMGVQPGGHEVAWQWWALGAFVVFVIIVLWWGISLELQLNERGRNREIIRQIRPLIQHGNSLLEINCRPQGLQSDGLQSIGDWLVEVTALLGQRCSEFVPHFENDGQVYHTDRPVACVQLEGRLKRLNDIMEELRKR